MRHAASTAIRGLAIGATDLPLSGEGFEQARRLAGEMASRPLVRILSSDRQRALATAQILAGAHGIAVEPTTALREIDFGAWEGRSLSDLWLQEPVAARAWESDIRLTPPSFGESLADVEARVRSLWESLQPLPDRGEVAVVAHRCSLGVLRAMIAGITVADALAMPCGLASASALTVG